MYVRDGSRLASDEQPPEEKARSSFLDAGVSGGLSGTGAEWMEDVKTALWAFRVVLDSRRIS